MIWRASPFAIGRRQVTVTECNQQTVTNSLQYAHIADYLLVPPRRLYAGSNAQNRQLWHQVACGPWGCMFTVPRCSLLSGIVGSWPTVRSAPRTVDGIGLADGTRICAADLLRPMYRITCLSRTRLHARSRVHAFACDGAAAKHSHDPDDDSVSLIAVPGLVRVAVVEQ